MKKRESMHGLIRSATRPGRGKRRNWEHSIISGLVGVLAALLFLLFFLCPKESDAVVRRMVHHKAGLKVVHMTGTVDQAALDTAATSCGTGCNLRLDRSATATGSLVVDNRFATDGMVVSGFPRKPYPVWQQKILPHVVGAGIGVNNCSLGFECQDENYFSSVCVTGDTGGSSFLCPETQPGAPPNGVRIGGIRFDGRKDLQPARRNENCTNTGGCGPVAQGNGNGSHWQILVRFEEGNDHELAFAEVVDSNNNGVSLQNDVDGFRMSRVEIDDIGCHTSDARGDCGTRWVDVPTRFGTAEGRQTDGFALLLNGSNDNFQINDSEIGWATKYSVQIGIFTAGTQTSCPVGAPTDGVIERMTLFSHASFFSVCDSVFRDSTISDVGIEGEEALGSVAQGLSFIGFAFGSSVENIVIDNIQNIGFEFMQQSGGMTADKISVSNACTTFGGTCAPIVVKPYADSQLLATRGRLTRSTVDVSGASYNSAILVTGCSDTMMAQVGNLCRPGGVPFTFRGDAGLITLNRIIGNAGSLINAIELDNIGGIELGYNTMDWSAATLSGGAIRAIEVDGAASPLSAVIQADAFSEQNDAGSGYTGPAGAVRLDPANTGNSNMKDCYNEIGAPTPTECYDEYVVAVIGDTQFAGDEIEKANGNLDTQFFDEQIACLIDYRDAYYMGQSVGCSDEAVERWPIKLILGVGDIVQGANQTIAMAKMAEIYGWSQTVAIPTIPWVAPLGNHDITGTNATNYSTFFGNGAMGHLRSNFRSSLDSDPVLNTPSKQAQYNSGTDVAFAHRIKALDKWFQVIVQPFSVNGVSQWYNWNNARLAEYPTDYAIIASHSLAADTNQDESCDALGFLTDRQHIINEGGTGGGANYRNYYMTAAGHATPTGGPLGAPFGWSCHTFVNNDAGDRFLWQGLNFQQRDDGALYGNPGDGITSMITHDIGDDSMSGVLYSREYDSDPGCVLPAADCGFPDKVEASREGWRWGPEGIDLTTRGGAGDPP